MSFGTIISTAVSVFRFNGRVFRQKDCDLSDHCVDLFMDVLATSAELKKALRIRIAWLRNCAGKADPGSMDAWIQCSRDIKLAEDRYALAVERWLRTTTRN